MSNLTELSIGKRKSSIARVRFIKGNGKILINNCEPIDYFKRKSLVMVMGQPLKLVDFDGKYDIVVNVKGGGLSGQVGALVHGISKALVMFDSNSKTTLKKEKLTTRDSRAVERKKYGRRKARRSFQFSKR